MNLGIFEERQLPQPWNEGDEVSPKSNRETTRPRNTRNGFLT
jgi:hypothetical protein